MMKALRLTILFSVAIVAIVVILVGHREKPFNLLLVSFDTTRPDHLGCYGYPNIDTPNIDRIASEGIIFRDAVTSVPLTAPSHSTILTGLYPTRHGVRDNSTFVLGDEITTLAEILKAEGYSTAAFVSAFVLDSRFGLDQGFDLYNDDVKGKEDLWTFEIPQRPGKEITEAAVKWLTEVKEPFFCFLHYYDPHTPYEPPPPFDSIYTASPYDGEIAYADYEFGKVLDEISRRNLKDHTMIVIVSDHGEGLGEHNESAHGILMYESTMKVAFLLDLPRSHPLRGSIPEHLAIEQTVGLVDVTPTLLDLLGVNPPDDLDGRSLVPLLEGEKLPPRFYYLETFYAYLAYKWSPLRGIRFNKWKFILAPEPELYNLAEDPHETTNLYLAEEDRARALKENLKLVVSKENRAAISRAQLSPEEERKLRALGYVSASRAEIPTDIEPHGKDPKHMIAAVEKYFGGGMDAFVHHRLEEAREDFAQMVEIDPDNIQARMFLGRTLMEMGDLEGAAQQFLKATEIDSTYSQGFFRLGVIYREMNDLDKSLMFFRIAAHLFPETPGVLSNIGSILFEKGKSDSAMLFFNKALEVDPEDPKAHFNIGLLYLSQDRVDSALTWFHKTLKVDPGHLKALVNIATIYIKMGNPDSTLAYLEKARAVAPDDPKILENLGNAYRQKGMSSQAAEAFQSALQIDPNNYMALFGLAAIRAQEGNTQESIQLLKKVLKIKPDFTPAKNALSRLTEKK